MNGGDGSAVVVAGVPSVRTVEWLVVSLVVSLVVALQLSELAGGEVGGSTSVHCSAVQY